MPRCLKHVQRSQCVDLKIEKWDLRGAIMRRLSRSVNDQVGLQFLHEGQDRFAIADVDRHMAVVRNLSLQLAKHPACVTLGAKEYGAMVAIYSRDTRIQGGQRSA